jgi:hypothetical protein
MRSADGKHSDLIEAVSSQLHTPGGPEDPPGVLTKKIKELKI